MTSLSERTMEIKIKGKNYVITETKLSDYEAFRDLIKGKRIKQIIDSTRSLSIGERTVFLNEAVKEVVTDNELQQELVTINGTLFMIYRALLHKQPNITFEDTQNMFTGLSDKEIEEITSLQSSLSEPNKEEQKNSEGVIVANL